MGLMECPPAHSRIVYTPHPITLEGQTNIAAELVPGETLGAFLRRTVPDWSGDAWEVRINGVVVPVEVMERVRPKDRTVIEVRGVVRKQALYIIAFAVLTYFTFGLGAAAAGGAWGAGAAAAAFGGGLAGALFATAVFAAGSILINKVLGPKPAGSNQREPESVYNIGAGRNQARQYQPLPLVFGTVKYAPDILSAPYTWYEGRDQYLGMVLTPGINAHSYEPLFNGDALLSSFQGVQVYQAGFPGMADQQIPLYSDADTIAGGELNKNQTWVQRTTPVRTVRVQVNLEYILGDQDSKGKPFTNRETVQVQYRAVGAPTWQALVSREFRSSTYDQQRATLAADVPEGQYDVRVRILGQAVDGGGSNGRSQWQWTTLTAVQADTATYAGIPRIGVRIKATGQLNGAPDELRCVVHSRPIPVWKGPGAGWVTEETSNPGAQILQYSRGINDENGDRIGGIGLTDDMIDIEALQAFMLHCDANSFEYNYVVKDARSHDEMVNALAMAGFGQVTWASGRLSVVWASDEQPLSGVVNMATIKKGEFQVDYTLANAADGIEYTYYDAEDWSTKTIRVPAPGVTTMLNPATVTGEGVTSEAHAAMLARWHLAQSLYQYKDISFATDIEHLSYQRLSLLSLSHDLTQWGFSGRLVGVLLDGQSPFREVEVEKVRVVNGQLEHFYELERVAVDPTGKTVSLQLDEPVRAPAAGSAYIGLRIPGERTYRVFGVQPFTGESATLTLTSAWPSDAPLPGNSDGNPAHDTLWCYDFKATPGYRVRVVAIEPESDLKGARVAVVPESPEYWHYVRTGQYIPAPNESLLQTRPVASNLTVSERDVVQGDTVFTELVATFDVDGPVGDVIVQMSNENGELVEVARTTSRTAAWRIPGAGTYQVVVRPFAPDGRAGMAVATIYSTIGADAPPVLVDLFDVVERSGGVRLYTWGWLSGTTQSADFAGVEIRYLAGNVPAPDWDAMTPVGEDGYHTAPFEAVIPESGQWTFAARSRNTSGTLSTGMRVVTKTLGANLGEQMEGIGDAIDYITQQQVAQQEALDAESFARVQADIAVAEAAGADATAKANAARDQALAGVDALANVVEQIDTRVDGVDGQVGNLASRVGVVEARMPGASGVLATQASVTNLQTATAAADAALADSITTVQATANGAQSTATSALAASATNASAITQVQAGQAGGGNMLANADFGAGSSGLVLALSQWGSLASGVNWGGSERVPQGGTQFGFTAGNSPQGVVIFDHASEAPATEGENWIASARLSTLDARAKVQLLALDANGAVIDYAESGWIEAFAGVAIGSWPLVSARFANGTPPGTTRVRWRWETDRLRGTNPYSWVTQPALAKGAPGQTQPGPWAVGAAGLASATFALQVAQDAQITLTTNVNGHVSGMVSKNDGQRSVVSWLADVFEIITSGTVGVRFTRRNGGYFMRFYAASVQTILGINFGASNNLCFWYGPNVGEENCTQANGTIWFNNAGSAYFGGSLSAGVLKNAAQSTQISTTATVDTGPFTTNGGARVVNSSMSYTNGGYTATDQGGTVALSAGVVLERSRDNGATWTQISNFTATGQRIFVGFEQGLGYNYRFDLNGSTTYTDNTGGTANVNYRLRITSNSGPWPFNFGTGANPLGRQNLAVISVEQ